MADLFLEALRRQLVHKAEAFPGLAGFCVRDLVSTQQISVLGDEAFPSASTIKIFILVTLLRQAETNPELLRERISIQVRVPGSGVLTYLEDPVQLSLLDVAILM